MIKRDHDYNNIICEIFGIFILLQYYLQFLRLGVDRNIRKKKKENNDTTSSLSRVLVSLLKISVTNRYKFTIYTLNIYMAIEFRKNKYRTLTSNIIITDLI